MTVISNWLAKCTEHIWPRAILLNCIPARISDNDKHWQVEASAIMIKMCVMILEERWFSFIWLDPVI